MQNLIAKWKLTGDKTTYNIVFISGSLGVILRESMNIIYETNGLGFLGWIEYYPGAYVRGKTIKEAELKIENELNEYANWLNIKINSDKCICQIIKNSTLHIEDADSNIIFDSELTEFYDNSEFDYFLDLVLISGKKTELLYQKLQNKDKIDPYMQRQTFYGNVYSTINEQFKHIIKVQNYYLEQISTNMKDCNDFNMNRDVFVLKLKEKYKSEKNKIYENDDEVWTIKKIIRRIIWHDRIHSKAMLRMDIRNKG